MKIAYAAAVGDCSGYSDAARNNIMAINTAGVQTDIIPVSFESFRSTHEEFDKALAPMIKRGSDAPIQITHTVPLSFRALMGKGKYNIGYTVWETDKLPPDWVQHINVMDEIWVPCEHNVEVFKNSGVTKPVFAMPHTFNTEYGSNRFSNDKLPNINGLEDRFVFYTILQWTNRKAPDALLKAYLTEFEKHEDVALVIKAYIMNPNNDKEAAKIRSWISEIKQYLRLSKYPSVYLIANLLTDTQIEVLHQRGDCFVLLHACEGWGIPISESLLAGNPVITTGYGGPVDFINHKDTGFLVDYQLTPVYGMPWHTYTGDMNWASPDIVAAKKYMRWAFEHQDEAKQLGLRGQRHMQKNYSWQTVGDKMAKRLHQIQEKLNG